VFLSGRPLWTNPEINASDAFVAAWLPGSQGGGVADVLIRKPDGRINADFRGRLAYAWPRTAAQGPRQPGRAADPQFPFGFGLTYAAGRETGRLPEVSGVAASAAADKDVFYRKGRTIAPWSFALSDANVTMRPVDAGAQEAGQAITWTGAGDASAAIVGPAADLLRQTNGDMAIALRVRVDQPPESPVKIELGCAGEVCASLDGAALFKGQPVGEWRTLKVKLACFRGPAADLTKVTSPFRLRTAGRFGLSIADVALAANVGDAVCP